MPSARAFALNSNPGRIQPPKKTPFSSTRSMVTAVPKSATTTASSTTAKAAAAETSLSVPTSILSSTAVSIGTGTSLPITLIFSSSSFLQISATSSVQTSFTLLTTITPFFFRTLAPFMRGTCSQANTSSFLSFAGALPGTDSMNFSVSSRNSATVIVVLPISIAIMFTESFL